MAAPVITVPSAIRRETMTAGFVAGAVEREAGSPGEDAASGLGTAGGRTIGGAAQLVPADEQRRVPHGEPVSPCIPGGGNP